MRILFILAIFIGGCTSASLTKTTYEGNKDVLILSLLVQDHLRTLNKRDTNNIDKMLATNLAVLLKKDTLKRITNSFEKVELKPKGGHISVYYEFSKLRDLKRIELSEREKELTKYWRCREKDLKNQFDGEIQVHYGERFYRIIKIII